MPSLQPQRSTYRDRRINVMLQEGAPGDRGGVEREYRNVVNGWTSRPAMLAIALGTAALCALAVFFFLFRHDTAPVATNVPVQTAQASTQSAPNPVAKLPAPAMAPAQVMPSQVTPPPAVPAVARVQFRLSRSTRAQTISGLNLRLVSTNVRRGICSIVIKTANSRPNQYTIQANRPVKIEMESGANANVLVTGISKAAISGYVTGS